MSSRTEPADHLLVGSFRDRGEGALSALSIAAMDA
jgi:hypothetical protein